MTVTEPILLHLVYVHGFQGDHTTFQAFPTDLQEYLATHISSHLNIKVQSSLYPTYKSVKPIAHATATFLDWLATQPPGPVILLGHSMGGLLVSEASTHPSNNRNGQPQRIKGMIAFDCPYLGMHPHVVVTGIQSLFSKEEDDKTRQTEGEMNAAHPSVHMVDERVTADDHPSPEVPEEHIAPKGQSAAKVVDDRGASDKEWEAFKKKVDTRRPSPSPSPSNPRVHSSGAQGLAPSSPSSSASTMSISSLTSSILRLPPSPFVDKAVSFMAEHADDPVVRWLRKHSDEPFTASKRWVVEHFQFGICMFDPPGLKDRYKELVAWKGLWINYWTQTIPRKANQKERSSEEEVVANDIALIQNGVVPPSASEPAALEGAPPEETPSTPAPQPTDRPLTEAETKAARKAEEKQRQKAEKARQKELKKLQKQRDSANKEKHGRHFVVLPNGIGQALGGLENWEKVMIAGVEDEVAAHCGLFIRSQNLEYDAFVERVGQRVLQWCERLS